MVPLAQLGQGAFEIRTPRLTLSLVALSASAYRAPKQANRIRFPSGYVGSGIVTIQPGLPPAEAQTQAGCLSGQCAVTLAGATQPTRLDLNQYTEITREGGTL